MSTYIGMIHSHCLIIIASGLVFHTWYDIKRSPSEKIKLIPGHMANLKYMNSKVQKSQHSLPANPGLVAVFGGLKLT